MNETNPKPRIRSHSLTHSLTLPLIFRLLCAPVACPLVLPHTLHTPALSLVRSLAAHMKCGIVVSTAVHVNTVRCALTLIGITLKYILQTRQISNSTNFKTPNSVHALLLLLLLDVYCARACVLFEPKRPSIRFILFIHTLTHSHIKYISM